MNRTARAILAVVFVGIIMFSAVSICQNVGRGWRVDITEQKVYTLSEGTKAILGQLNQPIRLKLYYAKVAATKGSDQIQFFDNYYYFVSDLLAEYASAGGGMVALEEIDPRPYSTEEEDALRHGLKRFPITEDENFFFGLVVQTEFGVVKTIPFFSPDRQRFVEYDISYLIDTAINRQKTRIGVLSAMNVFGDEASGYMAQMMRMQGQQPKPSWGVIEQLRQRYEVNKIETKVEKIGRAEHDMLLVIHPKDLPVETRFAIDQFVLEGGPTIVLVDPFCMVDRPDPAQQRMGMMPQGQSSALDELLERWGLQMPANSFAGDLNLAMKVALRADSAPQRIIGFLGLNRQGGCFGDQTAVSADLNSVRMLFAGVLEPLANVEGQEGGQGIELVPLIMTTNRGNSWQVRSPYELMQMDGARLMSYFKPGSEAVTMGYLASGRFKSAYPNGVTISAEDDDQKGNADEEVKKGATKTLTGLTEADADCAVAVFADVDFVSDIVAYQKTLFGTMTVEDNSALLMNTIENMSGSSDLMAIRSRGNFRRPFLKVDAIEQQAEEETAEQVQKIQDDIAGYQQELSAIVSKASASGEGLVETEELNAKRRDLELQIRKRQRQAREVQGKRRASIEALGQRLQNLNMLAAPAIILVIAIVVGLRRSVRRRMYISHSSDA